ncbi:MAG TPA: hypothetical protein VFS07_04625 [Gemmatimonadales bacterium]|nr:hypothetical protein [Gemmatimonadales bacterium]
MDLPGLTYRGAPLDDLDLLERLPVPLQQLLAQRNGFVAWRGAIHVRGACLAPAWHSLRAAMAGRPAGEVPFARDALGREFVLAGGKVWREERAGTRAEIARDLVDFLQRLATDPGGLLPLEALLAYEAAGHTLRPGEVLP